MIINKRLILDRHKIRKIQKTLIEPIKDGINMGFCNVENVRTNDDVSLLSTIIIVSVPSSSFNIKRLWYLITLLEQK